jgi:hypothetical protein
MVKMKVWWGYHHGKFFIAPAGFSYSDLDNLWGKRWLRLTSLSRLAHFLALDMTKVKRGEYSG